MMTFNFNHINLNEEANYFHGFTSIEEAQAYADQNNLVLRWVSIENGKETLHYGDCRQGIDLCEAFPEEDFRIWQKSEIKEAIAELLSGMDEENEDDRFKLIEELAAQASQMTDDEVLVARSYGNNNYEDFQIVETPLVSYSHDNGRGYIVAQAI